MSAQGTGPYRQVLTEMTEELHVPNLTRLPLFIPNPNSALTDTKATNRNTIVPNPSAGATNALEMYEFVGRLIGKSLSALFWSLFWSTRLQFDSSPFMNQFFDAFSFSYLFKSWQNYFQALLFGTPARAPYFRCI